MTNAQAAIIAAGNLLAVPGFGKDAVLERAEQFLNWLDAEDRAAAVGVQPSVAPTKAEWKTAYEQNPEKDKWPKTGGVVYDGE
jgi:hypothetical protein